MTTSIHSFQSISDRYLDYLSDESGMIGHAESISFPESEKDVRKIVTALLNQHIPITIQGSRTGVSGGAIPTCGHILNLSKMNKIMGMCVDDSDQFSLHVQPGISLYDLERQILNKKFNTDEWDKDSLETLDIFKKTGSYFWPPDPSEKSASVGGIAANNARGICAYRYGPAVHHIKSIRVVDASGNLHKIYQGRYCLTKGISPLPGGRNISLGLSSKGSDFNYDLLDIYIGSEGMLGAITGLEISLKPLPAQIWGVVFFFHAQSQAIGFIQSLVSRQKKTPDSQITAIEFMDQHTLENIYSLRQTNNSLRVLPDIEKGIVSAVLIEIHSNEIKQIEVLSEWLMTTARNHNSDTDKTWAFSSAHEMDRFHLFRHAATESANTMMDHLKKNNPQIKRLAIDMQFDDTVIKRQLEGVQADLKQHDLSAAIFGHAGNGVLHIHILPETYPQYTVAKALIKSWACHESSERGRVITSHGLGKVNNPLFDTILLQHQMELLFRIKKILDPHEIWNPGNIKERYQNTD